MMKLRPWLRRASILLACVALFTSPARASAPLAERLIGFRSGTTPSERATVLARYGAVAVAGLDALGVVRARLLESSLASLASERSVAFVERDLRGTVAATPPSAPNDPTWNVAEQWRLRRVNAQLGWSAFPGVYYSASTKPRGALKVAILDTWIDTSHPDFANAGSRSVDARNGGQIDIVDRKDIVAASRQHGNMDWHGTFIAGLIGAATNNSTGVSGIAYQTQMIPITVADGNGVVTASDAAAGIAHAISRGAKVLNLSFAIPATSTSATLERAVQAANDAGAVIVAAAGNNGGDAPQYPAAYARDHANVIAVSATGPLDSLAPCSNYNSYITVSAPGTNLISLAPSGQTYKVACGTSAATALASGAAAGIEARWPGIAPAALRSRLAHTSDDVGGTGHDSTTGWGRLNLQRAVWAAAGPSTSLAKPVPAGIAERTTIVATATSSRGVAAAEYMIDGVAAAGRGVRMTTADRAWGATRQHLRATVDTRRLAEGVHDLLVRAKDRDGHWGPAAMQVLIVDRTAPAISTLKMDPPVVVPGDSRTRLRLGVTDALSTTMRVTIAFVDASGIAQASFTYRLPSGLYAAQWEGTFDAPASTRFTKPALPPGPYKVIVTAVDEAGRATQAETDCAVSPDPRVPTPSPSV